ncbi:hypothetical protein MicloDRAFT_00007100 [Microvirga lotononidis]|uniref:Uncharacterized protein n=1 Tax=Microvirga lotononidis TaxID=864069 RepID=I4Z2L9_9HYPH|nr:hypothetical protein MicloDRAFT_00007100 [Microvirga lotononidis]
MHVSLTRVIIGITFACWIALLAYGWWVITWRPSPCEDSVKITTEADAFEFGKYFLRHDAWFWRDTFQSVRDPDRELRKEKCCSVQRVDPQDNEGREWNVALRFTSPRGDYEYGYSVQFTSCRYDIVTDRWTERL